MSEATNPHSHPLPTPSHDALLQAAHDMRNAIGAIHNAATALLQQENRPHDLAEGLALIARNAETLAQLLDGLLQARFNPPASPAPSGRTPVPRRVLVVDDDPDVRTALCSLLRSLGHQVQQADSGRVALQLLSTHAMDFVLVDMSMPEMDGVAFVRTLREQGLHRGLVVVAISGLDSEAMRLHALQVGCNCFLSKPVPEAALMELLAAGTTSNAELTPELP